MRHVRHLVVGGGPAAAATAAALSRQGSEVTLIDAGVRLEPERDAWRARLANTTPDRWSKSDLDLFAYPKDATSGIGQKRLFGSAFPYRDPGAETVTLTDSGVHPSYALGGLSNVWGAGILPYTDRDLDGWPLDAATLAPHYERVLELLPFSATADDLEPVLPLHKTPDGLLSRSQQGEQILRRLKHQRLAATSRWRVGAARLAVRTGSPAPEQGCVYCGHCLDGCPYGHIYTAASTIDYLKDEGAIEYLGGKIVLSVTEVGASVTVRTMSLSDHTQEDIRADRVFLAAGALSTTFILQRSGLLPDEVELLDSQTLYLPILWLGRPPQPDRREYTLAQAFALLDDRRISGHPVHLSLYGYNPDLPQRVRDLRPRLARALGPLLERATRQLVVAICFLHSDESSRFTSRRDGTSFVLSGRRRPEAIEAIRRLKARLSRDLPMAGMLPLAPAAEAAAPGGGYHYGGSIPMRARPGPSECDLQGRPPGAQRIHVVDAAAFPTIPGGTITLSIMANAHRVASEVLSS